MTSDRRDLRAATRQERLSRLSAASRRINESLRLGHRAAGGAGLGPRPDRRLLRGDQQPRSTGPQRLLTALRRLLVSAPGLGEARKGPPPPRAARRLVLVAALLAGALLATSPPAHANTGSPAWEPPPYAEELTGPCLPREPRSVVRYDLLALALPPCPLPPATFFYHAPSPTGTVTTAGSYAFLDDPDDLTSAVDTYEKLRDGTTTALLIHQADAGGTSQAAFYTQVEPGDLMEWRQAADCFVRYQVLAVEPDPTGTAPQKLLRVEWMTYAFTGCSGPIPVPGPTGQTDTTGSHTLQWADLPDLGGPSLSAPVVHGVTQLIPEDWTGALVEPDLRGDPSGPPEYVYTTDITTARTLPYWREPRLPAGWTLEWAEGGPGSLYASVFGYYARYSKDRGPLVEIYGFYVRDALVRPVEAVMGASSSVVAETRVVNGRPVVVVHSPTDQWQTGGAVLIYDPPTETGYTIYGSGGRGGVSLDTLLEILGSLFEPPNAP